MFNSLEVGKSVAISRSNYIQLYQAFRMLCHSHFVQITVRVNGLLSIRLYDTVTHTLSTENVSRVGNSCASVRPAIVRVHWHYISII